MRFAVCLALVCTAFALTPRSLLESDIHDIEYYRGVSEEQWFAGARIIVKFRDELHVRTFPESLASHTGPVGLVDFRPRPLFAGVNTARVEAMLEAAARRSKRQQPDLLGTFIAVEFYKTRSDSTKAIWHAVDILIEEARRLAASELVEYVEWEPFGIPPPTEATKQTPLFVNRQTYRNSDPGIDAQYANDRGALGNGVRISDCEYAWTFTHEDIFPMVPEPGHTPVGSFADHGTASGGISLGVWNAFGISGNAPQAEFYTYSEQTVEDGYNRDRAVLAACVESDFGDIVLLEMQTYFPPRSAYSPAETSQTIWTTVRAASDAGVVVVAAAGNGNENLDSPPYAPYMSRGNSGSIIVGAGSASAQHLKLSFSTYGSRVDVQAWGEAVCTGGYGDLFGGSNVNQAYTARFSGTSSASAIVASATAALQSLFISNEGPIDGPAMRSLLKGTGIPQQQPNMGHIGPHVNLRRAIQTVSFGNATRSS